MILRRPIFFLAIILIFLIPILLFKTIWLIHSHKADGVIAFESMGNAGEQIKLDYTIIYFKHGRDTIWFNGMGNLHLHPGEIIPIRYQTDNPADAKVDLFSSIWGDSLVYGGIPTLMLFVLFLQPDIIPAGSKIKIFSKSFFILIT